LCPLRGILNEVMALFALMKHVQSQDSNHV
jgi:hypothetical protein